MLVDAQRYRSVAETVVATARTGRLTFLAAAIAYYALVSLFPLSLLGLAAASFFGGDALAGEVLTVAGPVLSPVAAGLVERTLVAASGRGGATLVGLGLLLWSGLKLFRGLDVAFEEIHGATDDASFLDRLRNAVVLLGGVGVGAVGAVATGVAVAFAGVGGAVVTPVVATVVLALLFLPTYYLAPAREMTVRTAVPGTVFAAVGWTVLGTAFGLYAERAAAFALYGVVGAILLLVTWYYVAALVVLLGATLNAALAGHLQEPDRQLQQPPRRQDRQER